MRTHGDDNKERRSSRGSWVALVLGLAAIGAATYLLAPKEARSRGGPPRAPQVSRSGFVLPPDGSPRRDNSVAPAVIEPPPTPVEARPLKLRSTWTNAGGGSAEDGLETALWAASNRNLPLLANSFALDRDVVARLMFFSMSFTGAQKVEVAAGSPPESIAELLALPLVRNGLDAVAGFAVLGRSNPSPNNPSLEQLDLAVQSMDGIVTNRSVLMQKTGGAWRLRVAFPGTAKEITAALDPATGLPKSGETSVSVFSSQ